MTISNNLQDMPRLERAIRNVVQAYDADVFFLSGNMQPNIGHRFVDMCPIAPNAQNCVMLLTTPGGDMEEAYRIIRCIQNRYNGISILFTNTLCKSAGTLIALGVDRLVMSDHSELGPLDTQVIVRDEIGEYQSGLIDSDALESLKQEVASIFRGQLAELLTLGNNNLTTPTALQIASDLTIGLFGGIYSQISPIRLGERGRAVRVALEYGQRVSSTNVKEGTLNKLATGYPSHGFVIDRHEAQDLFHEVYLPDLTLIELTYPLDPLVRYSFDYGDPVLEYLNHGISEQAATWLNLFGSEGVSDSEDEASQNEAQEPME